MAMHGGVGGPGSAEETRAATFNGGVARRNSITESTMIHSTNPSGAHPHMTAADFEGLRAGGQISHAALMAAIPAASVEQPWLQVRGGGPTEIRTGRNWQVPGPVGHPGFELRIHTNDPVIPAGAGFNAGDGPVVRVAEGRQQMLSAPVAGHADARMDGRSWMGVASRDPDVINAAHIPLV